MTEHPSTSQLICESPADQAFFRRLIEHHGIGDLQVSSPVGEDGVPLGRSGFSRSLLALAPLDHVVRVIIASDCDDDPGKSFNEVRAQIQAAGGYPLPTEPITPATDARRTVRILMVPWTGVPGNLESLLIDAIASSPSELTRCVDAYMACVGTAAWGMSTRSKAYLQALIAGCCKRNPTSSVQWVWTYDDIPVNINNHARFDQIANFLRECVSS